MAKAKKDDVKKEAVPCILDGFDFIGKTDKSKFVKMAEKYNISQEELLKLAVSATVKNKIPFKTRTIIEL